jgi:2-polyprenyl-3-methyl-5-hydroxy-6-metoxy-1,4-benzoquinol methylase
MRYIEEQQEWDSMVERMAGPAASLVSVSVHSSDCRIYRSDATVFKMRRWTPASSWHRPNSLENEFLLLRHLASIPGVPEARSYQRFGEWEVLAMGALPPLPGNDPTFGPGRETVSDFLDVVRTTLAINRRGCSHGDLHRDNVGHNIENGMSVFDFDQAQRAHPLRCMARDFLGLTADRARAKFSLFDRAVNVPVLGIVPRVFKAARRRALALMLSRNGERAHSLTAAALAERAAMRNDAALETLARAWDVAARSNASAPGVNIAYYSLDISGMNFPGERPWLHRWHLIRNGVDFRGKRFLELGCNMGLLSIHAKLGGAARCVALDRDSEILQGAKLAADGFGAEVEFRQADLNAMEELEARFEGKAPQTSGGSESFDIVSALSVMYWVKDKARLWSFLARFRELLYEGHESESEAIRLLQRAGFTQVTRLGTTERNRPVFLAKRD